MKWTKAPSREVILYAIREMRRTFVCGIQRVNENKINISRK